MPAFGSVTLIMTTPSGAVLNLGTAADASSCWIETRAMDFGEPRKVKFIDAVLYNISARELQTNLQVQIYGSDDEDGPFVLLDSVNVAEEPVFYTDPPGQKFFKLRFYDEVISDRWRLAKFEVWGELGGDEF